MTTAAAIDRLVHHCVILELNIPSYRVEQAKKANFEVCTTCWAYFDGSRAQASVITLPGSITQSTPDGTGPAVNNSSLNNIVDG